MERQACARARWSRLVLALGAGLACAGPLTAAPDTDTRAALQGGRTLFHDGLNRRAEEVQATVGGGVALQGSKVACARCHGSDGAGNREAGLTAPALLWSALSQSRAASTGLLPRTAYTEATLLRALREGLDADGRPLSSAMPRFTLAPRDQADLLSYVRALGGADDRDPGVTDKHVTFGGVLPLSGPLAAAGQAADAAIRACIEQGNRAGGIFGRLIVWQVLDSQRLPPTEIAQRLSGETIAVIAPWWNQLGSSELLQRLPGLPLIGPLGAAAELEQPNPALFAVAPQLSDQVRVLIDAYAEGDLDTGTPVASPPVRRLAVIATPGTHHHEARLASQRQALNHAALQVDVWPATLGRSDSAMLRDAMQWLSNRPADAVLVLGNPDWMLAIAQSMQAAEPMADPASRATAPRDRLLLGAFAEAGRSVFEWPASLRRRVRLSHSRRDNTLPDPGPLQNALAGIGAELTHPAVQSLAHAAACLSIEGLRRAGRDLSRQRLRAGIEEIRDFRTGIVGPLNFSRASHVGTHGSAVVRLADDGRSLETVRPWRTPLAW